MTMTSYRIKAELAGETVMETMKAKATALVADTGQLLGHWQQQWCRCSSGVGAAVTTVAGKYKRDINGDGSNGGNGNGRGLKMVFN
jgi:hypothetical protein